MTVNVMKDAVFKERIKKLKALEGQLAEFEENHLECIKSYSEINNNKVKAENDVIRLRKELQEIDKMIAHVITEIRQSKQKISTIRDELDINSRELEIRSVIENRKDFYAILIDRLTKLQEELKDNDIECKEPKEVISELRQQIDSREISEYHVFSREAKGKYDKHMRKQAENKVDGVKVSAKDHFNMNDYLDSFLKHEKVIDTWG